MSNILIPAASPEDWKRFLADPEKHWKKGYSARSLAYCWHEADGIPKEVMTVLTSVTALANLKPVFIIPEYKVPLPGGVAASQNDIWVLAEANCGLVSMTVEGKVSESFDVTVGEWFRNPSPGREKRLQYLCDELGLSFPAPDQIRYQLLHRAVSAIIEACRFNASESVMIVHSFSPTNEWIEDYQAFTELFGVTGGVNEAVTVKISSGKTLHLAWVHGDEMFLER